MSVTRPTELSQFHGQTHITLNLGISISSSIRQQKVHGHVLFTGPAGLGKTSLAISVMPNELSCESRFINCAAIRKAQDLTSVLASMPQAGILFLDEIHVLPPEAREHLLTAMEDQTVCVSLGDEGSSDIIQVDLAEFTVIGATTRQGQLDSPTLSRFQYIHRLEPYSDDEMACIVNFHATRRSFTIDDEAKAIIAAASHGVARNGVNLLESCIDTYFAEVSCEAGRVLSSDTAAATLDRLGIKDNLQPGYWQYLRKLKALEDTTHAAVGLRTLAAILDEEQRTIEEVYEPHLLREGFLTITKTGRRLTDKGRDKVREA